MSKCYVCKKSIRKNELFWDGNWSYCLDCVESKKIDSEYSDSTPVEWRYCQNCRNIVSLKDYIGKCDIQLECKNFKPYIEKDKGYDHLCFECGKSIKNVTYCCICEV